MDVNRAIRLVVNTGRTVFGTKEVKCAAEKKEAKLIIVANNCPDKELKRKKYKRIDIYRYKGNGHDLGSAAGKPFSMSTLAVIEPGESSILSLIEG